MHISARSLFAAFTLVSLLGCNSSVDVVHGLTEPEANEILVVLETQNIDASKKAEEGRTVTWAVWVPSSKSQEALRLLVANKLPKERSSGLSAVYPPGSGGLIPTQSEEKAKFLMAMQGEIEKMLKSFPGVQEARVVVVLPQRDVVRDLETPPPPATASVGIVYNPDNGQPPLAEDKVRALVSAAVEDLKPSNVQVVMKANRPPLLVNAQGLSAPTGGSAKPFMNIRVFDAKSRQKLMAMVGVFGGVTVLSLLAGIFGFVQWLRYRSKYNKKDAELTAMRKR